MHGGIYFNPLGGKPGVNYPRSRYPKGIPGVTIDEFPAEWFEGIPPGNALPPAPPLPSWRAMVCAGCAELYLSRRYSVANNCYGVKSGLDQAGWESSGWIRECDPRG